MYPVRGALKQGAQAEDLIEPQQEVRVAEMSLVLVEAMTEVSPAVERKFGAPE